MLSTSISFRNLGTSASGNHPIICQMPPDVLYVIFKNMIPRKPYRSYRTLKELKYFVAASHVCRYFREVMLEHPTLWGTVCDFFGFYPPNMDRISTMLERSKSAPIDVHVSHLEVLKRLESEVYRIRSFNLFVPDLGNTHLWDESYERKWWDGYHKFVQCEVPQLIEVDIQTLRQEEMYIPLFQGCTPKLKYVRSDFCSIDFKNSLPSVQSLMVSHISRTTAAKWLSIMSKLPNLREVYISSKWFSLNINHEDLGNEYVILPYLRKFHIEAAIPLCSDLISRLHIPKTALLYLEADGAGTRAATFFKPITHTFSGVLESRPVNYHASFTCSGRQSLSMEFRFPPTYVAETDLDDKKFGNPLSIHFSNDTAIDVASAMAVFDSVRGNACITSLELNFHLPDPVPFQEEDEWAIYRYLNKLDEVQVLQGTFEGLLPFLTCPSLRSKKGQEVLPLPALHTLVIGFGYNTGDFLRTREILSPVSGFIQYRRSKLNVHVRRLILVPSAYVDLTRKDITMFREELEDVIVTYEKPKPLYTYVSEPNRRDMSLDLEVSRGLDFTELLSSGWESRLL